MVREHDYASICGEGCERGSNIRVAEYTVVVNMANGEITQKVSDMETLRLQGSATTINLDGGTAIQPEKDAEEVINYAQNNKPQEDSVYIASAVAIFAVAGIVAATFLRSRASKPHRG